MNSSVFQVKFWGVRGSIPVCGAEFDVYGGNTPCIEVRCGEHRLIFDAGSGIRQAGLDMMGDKTSNVDLFFSHCHYDHIIGLPFSSRSTILRSPSISGPATLPVA